ncbi:hypothetical protein MRX96_050299 [Rhipicephalus microplus]
MRPSKKLRVWFRKDALRVDTAGSSKFCTDPPPRCMYGVACESVDETQGSLETVQKGPLNGAVDPNQDDGDVLREGRIWAC